MDQKGGRVVVVRKRDSCKDKKKDSSTTISRIGIPFCSKLRKIYLGCFLAQVQKMFAKYCRGRNKTWSKKKPVPIVPVKTF